MKKIYSLILFSSLSAAALTASAATGYSSVALKLADNSTLNIAMEEDMTTTVADGNVVLDCAKGKIIYPIHDGVQNPAVKSWTFSTLPGDNNHWSGIDGVENEAGLTVVLDGETLNVYGAGEGTALRLVDMAGRQMYSGRIDGQGSVSLSGFAKGIYVVALGNKSFKIVLK